MRATSGVLRFTSLSPALDQRRRSERRSCRLRVGLITPFGMFHARLEDISEGGVGFALDTMLMLKPGERLTLAHEALGEVPCIVRWCLHPRYGAEFVAGGSALAGVRALYDSLPPPAAGPV